GLDAAGGVAGGGVAGAAAGLELLHAGGEPLHEGQELRHGGAGLLDQEEVRAVREGGGAGGDDVDEVAERVQAAVGERDRGCAGGFDPAEGGADLRLTQRPLRHQPVTPPVLPGPHEGGQPGRSGRGLVGAPGGRGGLGGGGLEDRALAVLAELGQTGVRAACGAAGLDVRLGGAGGGGGRVQDGARHG